MIMAEIPKYNPGESVLVDKKFRGGYLAEIVKDYGRMFVRIKCGDAEWDLMKNRVELHEKS